MYKYLLCWRYLRTRYIALVSIVSVMLGVATMIVVNAVMAGFSEKMRERLHGILADVVVESYDLDGFTNADEVMARIRETAGDRVEAMAPTMETFGLMKIVLPNGQSTSRQIQILGIRPEERARTGDFAEFLFAQNGKPATPSFQVPEDFRYRSPAGMVLRESAIANANAKAGDSAKKAGGGSAMPGGEVGLQGGLSPNGNDDDDEIFKSLRQDAAEQVPDHGAIIGYALATFHRSGHDDFFIAPEGAKVMLTFVRGGRRPEPGHDSFTVVSYFKSGMSEYDSTHVYVPLERLQYVRGLGDGEGKGAVNQIQIKVKDGVDLDRIAVELQEALEPMRPLFFKVSTWEQKQGPLLAAVSLEQGILNILLFFIIAVAGFGILAIFFMIVVEKTRDIGILKALGASTAGVRGIFLGYGLLLGMVGSGVGLLGGLLFVWNINTIESWMSRITGRKVFDDQIYYFDRIPTLIEPYTVIAIVAGALFIAVIAGVWPAQRAARLHPVRALRFE